MWLCASELMDLKTVSNGTCCSSRINVRNSPHQTKIQKKEECRAKRNEKGKGTGKAFSPPLCGAQPKDIGSRAVTYHHSKGVWGSYDGGLCLSMHHTLSFINGSQSLLHLAPHPGCEQGSWPSGSGSAFHL